MTIVVVAAVVERDGSYLVTRRQEGVHLAGFWEFPGGKVHERETHASALRREMLEELDVDVAVGERILHTAHTYPERSVELHFYRCALIGTPRPLLGQRMEWVTREALPTLRFPEADAELIQLLAAASR